MTAPLPKGTLDAIRARHLARTSGPHKWHGNTGFDRVNDRHLVLANSRLEYVMDFVRSGVQGAQPRFPDDSHSLGIMRPASDFIVPAAEHHPWEVGYIDHPDAIGLAASWQDVDDLLAEVDRLIEQVKDLQGPSCQTCAFDGFGPRDPCLNCNSRSRWVPKAGVTP